MPKGIYQRTEENITRFWLGKKRAPTSEATKDKIRKSKIGVYHIKDRTQLKTDRQKAYDTQYKYWMLAVKKRDHWKCKIGDENCKGRLEAHHILAWRDHTELRYSINNGITLCQYHHPRKRSEEVELSPYFQELIYE